MVGIDKPIRVMVVDDHKQIRDSLKLFLSSFDDLEYVGEAEDGLEALAICGSVKPHVILMDVLMPKMNGVDATRMIRSKFPKIKIIALTSFNDEGLISTILSAGATGGLLKNAPIEAIANAIRSAFFGTQILLKTYYQPKQRPLNNNSGKKKENSYFLRIYTVEVNT